MRPPGGLGAALVVVPLALAGCATFGKTGEDDVTPGEDLMQEHGVIERILLIYDESARRIERGEPFEPGVLRSSAGIVRSFVEDYHEKHEEEFVFPRLQKAGREAELVGVLALVDRAAPWAR